MNKNTRIFIFGAVTMLFALWCIGCQLAADQAAEEEDWYTMEKCDLVCMESALIYWIFIELKSIGSLQRNLNEARSRIQELEEKHAQEKEKCENNRA